MQQLRSLWLALDTRRRVVVALATLAMFTAVLGLSRLAATPSMSLLYAGLESAAAGDVVKALDQHGVTYQVRGDSIWVPDGQRDQLRMSLAAEGLPANGGAGYELLDSLSGFGTTAQMFDAAYWRAKEGELARTIVTSPLIRAARVYISPTQSQPFQRDLKPTASVMVTTTRGRLPPEQAKALKYLVSSAVSGLLPEDVAIIDSVSGLVLAADDPGGMTATGDRAGELKHNVETLLEARVGAGKSVVAVTIEPVTDRESIVEKTFDPAGRVPISTDTEDHTSNSTDKGSGAVTVASNLPTGQANGTGSTAQSQDNSTHERTNYEVSSTQREVQRGPGSIRRLTVAVLVDGIRGVDAAGKESWAPRPDAELATLHDLVASAVGYDEKRGDVITIRSLAFQPVTPLGTAVAPSLLSQLGLDPMLAVQLAVLAIVALALGLFVVRPILASSRGRGVPALPLPGAADPAAARVLTGEIDDGSYIPENLSIVSPEGRQTDAETKAVAADPVARLRRLIAERQGETVEILRSWVDDREETAP
ncbi:MAG: flagellar M-ring protein FliF [Rhodobacteraceae bacterium]|nr:flagellar M-ring protein FliF [Paracoccaceae bacterium]